MFSVLCLPQLWFVRPRKRNRTISKSRCEKRTVRRWATLLALKTHHNMFYHSWMTEFVFISIGFSRFFFLCLMIISHRSGILPFAFWKTDERMRSRKWETWLESEKMRAKTFFSRSAQNTDGKIKVWRRMTPRRWKQKASSGEEKKKMQKVATNTNDDNEGRQPNLVNRNENEEAFVDEQNYATNENGRAKQRREEKKKTTTAAKWNSIEKFPLNTWAKESRKSDGKSLFHK